MTRPRCRAMLAGLLLCLLAAPALPADRPAQEGRCDDAPLRIAYHTESDFAHACEAWRRVTAFLVAARGLRVDAPIDVVFAAHVAIAFGTGELRVLGTYDRTQRVLHVTSFRSAWLRDPDRLMFGLPVDAELHVSLIVHELTHAVMFDNMRVAVPGRVGPEYMAYVVQLATMAPATRSRLLAGYPEGDFGSVAEITEVRHLMAPHEFGVRAWRHFSREGDARLLDLILSGGLGVDLPP